jgi:CubicO group peptidase (beta-lactamase class C family)
MDIITPAGAGSMYSSVRDLYTWDRSFYTEKILSYPAKTMATVGYNQEYGYGWIVRKTNGRTEVSHSGKSPDGFVSNLIRFPEEEISIIFLSNYGDTNGKQLSNELISIVFDLPYTLPVAKKEIVLGGEILNQYVGLYKLNDQFKISVSLENNKLYGLAEGDSQKIELRTESESKFFLKGPEIEIEFIKENGTVKYLLIKQQGGVKLTKIG